MSSENNQNANLTNKPESSSKINALIDALQPLCTEFFWLRDSIDKLQSYHFPDTYFEVSGLARLFAYELINQRPDLFTENNTQTLPLKELIIQYLNHVNVSKKHKENLAKIAEQVFNNISKEHILAVNKQAKSK